jgi:hypothetical protein
VEKSAGEEYTFRPKIKTMKGKRYKMVMEENLIPFMKTEKRPSCRTAPPAIHCNDKIPIF